MSDAVGLQTLFLAVFDVLAGEAVPAAISNNITSWTTVAPNTADDSTAANPPTSMPRRCKLRLQQPLDPTELSACPMTFCCSLTAPRPGTTVLSAARLAVCVYRYNGGLYCTLIVAQCALPRLLLLSADSSSSCRQEAEGCSHGGGCSGAAAGGVHAAQCSHVPARHCHASGPFRERCVSADRPGRLRYVLLIVLPSTSCRTPPGERRSLGRAWDNSGSRMNLVVWQRLYQGGHDNILFVLERPVSSSLGLKAESYGTAQASATTLGFRT